MNKQKAIGIIKEYLNIFIFLVFIISYFSGNISFASDCEEFGLDRCRDNVVTPSSPKTSDVDYDGNIPIKCNDVDFEYNDFPGGLADIFDSTAITAISNKGDYFYNNKNQWCITNGIKAISFYTLTSSIFTLTCQSCNQADQDQKIYIRAKLKKKLAIEIAKQGLKQALKTGFLTFMSGTAAVFFIDPISFLKVAFILDTAHYVKTSIKIPLSCGDPVTMIPLLSACSIGYAASVVTPFKYTMEMFTKESYNNAKDTINKIKFCGHDWNNFAYTSSSIAASNNSKEWYPESGPFSGSYEHKLKNCFQLGVPDAEELYGKGYCNDIMSGGICDGNQAFCNNVSLVSRTKRNRVYREILYGGKEFDSLSCKDPRLFTSRGYYGYGQRYYFRGNNSPKYYCDRFNNYKNQGCIYNDVEISRADVAKDPQKLKNCKDAFREAYECCEKSRLESVCIYDSSDTNSRNGTFCSKSNELFELYSNISCEVSGAKFKAFESESDVTKICIKNVNYCPYSFNLSGGTTVKELYCDGGGENCSENDLEAIYIGRGKTKHRSPAFGQIKNFCQYNSHCVSIGINSSSMIDMNENKYLSPACLNFVGDSQNLPYSVAVDDNGNIIDRPAVNDDFSLNQYRGLVAPVAQCFKDTLYNLFMNKAATSKCTESSGEQVNEEGLCGVDTYGPPESIRENVYEYKIGDTLPDNESIFLNIQKRLQNIVKLVAILALVVIGFMFLQKGKLDIFNDKAPRNLVFEMMKFAIVFYFAVGNAWQSKFYDWLNRGAQYSYYQAFNLASIGYQNYRTDVCIIDNNENTECECSENSDGTYSSIDENVTLCPSDGTHTYSRKIIDFIDTNGKSHEILKYHYDKYYDGCYFGDNKYKSGKEYLSIFDSFDCKLARYFGYGPEVNLPGIINTIILSLIITPMGIMIFFVGFIFFIYILKLTLKALYMFLVPTITLNLIIFLTPIIIPMLLFKKYKSIFSKWIDGLIGYSLQFMFAVILSGFILGSLDRIYLGSAVYHNHDEFGRYPKVDCRDTNFDSLVCVFAVNASSSTEIWPSKVIYDYLGIGVNINSIKSIYGNGSKLLSNFSDLVKLLFSIIKAIVVTFIFVSLFDYVVTLSTSLVGGSKTLTGSLPNMGVSNFSKLKNSIGIASRVGKGAAKTTTSGANKIARGLVSGTKYGEE